MDEHDAEIRNYKKPKNPKFAPAHAMSHHLRNNINADRRANPGLSLQDAKDRNRHVPDLANAEILAVEKNLRLRRQKEGFFGETNSAVLIENNIVWDVSTNWCDCLKYFKLKP